MTSELTNTKVKISGLLASLFICLTMLTVICWEYNQMQKELVAITFSLVSGILSVNLVLLIIVSEQYFQQKKEEYVLPMYHSQY